MYILVLLDRSRDGRRGDPGPEDSREVSLGRSTGRGRQGS